MTKSFITSNRLKGSAAVLALALAPALAFASVTVGDKLGSTEEEIRAMLEQDGYVIEEIEVEGDEIEVEATKDSIAYEIEIATETGEVIEIEIEKDDVDDDND